MKIKWQKNWLVLLLLVLSAVAVVACQPAAPAATESESDAIDIANLPTVIDVETAAALNGRDDVLLIDVREQWEYDEGHIPGITHIPMGEIPARLAEIPEDVPVILTCRSGNRSGQVSSFLAENGYTNVHNMNGGILAWQAAGFEVEN